MNTTIRDRRSTMIGCRRCGAEATVRVGREFLCGRCALLELGSSQHRDRPSVVCDLCERESIVRLGQRFLCATCALAQLSIVVADVGRLVDGYAQALRGLLRGDREEALIRGWDLWREVENGTLGVAEASAVHHSAMASLAAEAADPRSFVGQVEAAAVLFAGVAAVFDRGLERVRSENATLRRQRGDLDRTAVELRRERDELRIHLRRTGEARRQAVSHLLHAKEEERNRIAVDLHDDTVQVLVGVQMRLQAMRLREHDAGRARALQELETTIKLCLERLRRVMFELRSDVLEGRRLSSAIRQFLLRTRDQFGLAFRLEDRLEREPGPEIRTDIYRICQEALVNVRRHARAGSVHVSLDEEDGGIAVRIRDDGIGFQPGPRVADPGHLGLSVMHERAELAGGWVRISSAPGAGTLVHVWVPLADPG